MELLVASAIGLMTACGTYLVLRKRTFPVIVGLAMLTYAVNVFIFASGRLAIGLPAIITDGATYSDPLTQALVLTAIVISFGMTALIVMMALGSFLTTGEDYIGMDDDAKPAAKPAAKQEGDA
ncbi:multisubunit potassium/proton antiporter, PhaC subunit [Pseudorhodobacter antarcticus]|jgi:multicomponent K+:H+ antiporter subunit C|uniref:Multisubunit potassium/proton antiporter, PhaC subunit n=1 Tax=Pseudorhodobacter antarcticus TaxID=1077947 RepID=A0A1H8E3N1_9RHOB|nr:Na+/H+ antiporter subunit C [Pseudorhodobacter antarcticus]SEN14026.1 multisubunit potassium/proton antiporter, PhaC subunit [Pseudorhodobacter antarcticus]